MGLIDAQRHGVDLARYRTFEDLIVGVFGPGIARLFMMPYNFKVWAHPPRMMNKEWIGERMAVVNLQKVLGNIILQQDDVAWGPNATFKYPRYGGTGGLFGRMQLYVQDQLRLNAPVAEVNPLRREVRLEDGTVERYDLLLSTIPLDLLVQRMTDGVPDEVREQAAQLRHSGSYIVGVGLRQPSPSEKCWIYFPEDDAPFYRVTYLSNYSPDVVPDPATHYSLLAEISRSPFKEVDRATVVEDTIRGMISTRLLREEDRKDIVDAHLIERDYTYPVPSLERDRALACLMPWLDSENVFSRGRFGAWRYEVGNMDHSVAQGVEWVNRVLLGEEAEELTYQARRGC
jgi:UDP-galactopyranose mutase